MCLPHPLNLRSFFLLLNVDEMNFNQIEIHRQIQTKNQMHVSDGRYVEKKGREGRA